MTRVAPANGHAPEPVYAARIIHADTRGQLVTAGREIGQSTLMAHCGGAEITYADLEQIPTPPATESYTPVPHLDFVHAMYKHGDRLMGPKGFVLDGQRYVTSHEGQRLFFVHSYKSTADSNLMLAVAARNSYDKSMKAAVAFGARVFICDNLALHGQQTILRRHTGKAVEYLQDQIVLKMYEATDAWDDMRRGRDRMVEYALEEDEGYALMGMACAKTAAETTPARRLLDNGADWGRVVPLWKEPARQYQGGGRTLWAWYNAFTFDFKSLKPADQMPRHASLHRFATSCLDGYVPRARIDAQLRAADQHRQRLDGFLQENGLWARWEVHGDRAQIEDGLEEGLNDTLGAG